MYSKEIRPVCVFLVMDGKINICQHLCGRLVGLLIKKQFFFGSDSVPGELLENAAAETGTPKTVHYNSMKLI